MELSDLFSKKSKKGKPKPVNLNSVTVPKDEPKKAKVKGGDDGQWIEDDNVAATEMKVQALANLDTAEEKKDDVDASQGVHWNTKKQGDSNLGGDKRFPTLQKARGGKQAAMQDDREQAALKTHKNKFGALDDEEEDEVKAGKPAAMVTKKQGERQEDAVARANAEAAKLKKQQRKEKAKAEGDDVASESEEEEDEEEAAPERRAEQKKAPKKVSKANKENRAENDEHQGEAPAPDTLIEPDLIAARSKYADRHRLPLKDLPRSEREAEKSKAVKPKKNVLKVEEDDDKKMLYAPDDW